MNKNYSLFMYMLLFMVLSVKAQYTAIPDANFEAELGALGYDDIANDGQAPTALIVSVSTLNISNRNISNLEGIEDFTALEILRLDLNNLQSLDVSNNHLLAVLTVSKNNLKTLKLPDGAPLSTLWLHENQLTELDLSQYTALKRLSINDNLLTSVNIKNGNNKIITNFNATDNPDLNCILVDDATYSTANWTNIDAQTSFTDTYCRYTAIPDIGFETRLNTLGYDDIAGDGQVPTALIEVVTNLDISGLPILNLSGLEDFTALTSLNVSNSVAMLTTLDLSNNLNLVTLIASDSNFDTLNLGTNINYQTIIFNRNQLTEFEYPNMVSLDRLDLSENPITKLNLSSYTALEDFLCNSCDLSVLNIKNGTNREIIDFEILNNPNLTCILVDDAALSTKNWTAIDAQASFTDTYCRYTAIPDSAFETALENLGYDDISGDGKVPTALIENVISLNLQDQFPKIENLTGIEAFTALEVLDVRANKLTQLNLSANTNLIWLNCDSNRLETNTLNLTGLTKLEEFYCSNNDLTSLAFPTNSNLKKLYFESQNNTLISVDVSNNPLLTDLISTENASLLYLNLKNGNNALLTNFDVSSSQNLSCILVDNAAYSTANWSNSISSNTSFSDTYCRYTAIPDFEFEVLLNALGYDDIPGDGQVPTALIEVVTNLNLSTIPITNLSGLEDFAALTYLDITYSHSALTTLDVSNNTNLVTIIANNSNFDTIDLGTNTNYETIDFGGSKLTEFDYPNLTNLKTLILGGNLITNLDLSTYTALETFNASYCNNLSSLNIKNHNNEAIVDFQVTNNPNLTCIRVDDAAYSTTNWTAIDAQTSFTDGYCRYTQIPDAAFETALENLGYDDISGDGQVPTALIENVINLDVQDQLPERIEDLTGIEDFKALITLDVTSNNISDLDLSGNTHLISLNCQANVLELLNLTGLTKLEELICENNPALSALDLTTNGNLKKIHCSDTGITSIDLSQLLLLTDLDCHMNPFLTFLNIKNGNNENFTTFNTKSTNSLTCILVDDAAYSTANWTNIGSNNNFSDTYCRYTAIPDAAFETALENLGYDDISGDGQVPTALIENVINLDVQDQLPERIEDLTGIEDFKALRYLDVRFNLLTDIDVSSNTNLVTFLCASNDLQALNVLGLEQLEELYCQDNFRLSQLNVNTNISLKKLNCSDTQIAALDLSSQSELTEFICNHNQVLNSLNIKNGNNTTITNFNISSTPGLTCILVDDTAYSTTNWTNVDQQHSFSDTYCRYTAIPDAAFETALENLGYDDISGDGQVPTALIENITELDVSNKSISDITGISDFIELKILNLNSNSLNTINVSALENLEELFVSNNNLTAVNTSGLKKLTRFQGRFNSYESLDFSDNKQLIDLNMENCTMLTSINISQLELLEVIDVSDCAISSLDLSSATELVYLDAWNNTLTEIDFTNNSKLTEVYIAENSLSNIDVSMLPSLEYFFAKSNPLLTSLNIKNNNNDGIISFDVTSTPNLTCILVDDVDYSTVNWTNIDAGASFSDTACGTEFPVAVKVFLQGPSLNPNTGEESLMRDDLRVASLLPTTSPYTDGATCDTSVFNTTGNDAIVDWIWVELRNAADASEVIYGRSTLLQRDGDIVDVDGTSNISFSQTSGDYYIVVSHRNHLSVRSAATISLSSTVNNIDFTSDTSLIEGGSNAVVLLSNGKYAIVSGDYDANGQIQNTDIRSVISELGGSGYKNADMDMNGQVQNSDINAILNINLGRGVQFTTN